jgi:rhamnose transport system ATP-binding protein
VSTPVLKLESVEKSFAGVHALKPLSLELLAGEILGLVGENGAGKSTLIKILSGVFPPDRGQIFWKGDPIRFHSPRQALAAGIATIHQELAYFGHLSVAENLLLGESWPRLSWGGVDWNAVQDRARAQLARFELEIDPQRPFHSLSSAQKQEIAIVRALSRESRLLILDEPTASLSEADTQRLMAHLRRLRAEGVAILYVSHRLDEVLQLTDRVAVLRDGELRCVLPTREAGVDQLVREMVGRPLEQVYPHARPQVPGELLLEIERLNCPGMFHDVSFTLHAGEIVGLAGLVGAGRSEVARAIFGLYPTGSGWMRLRGKNWSPRSPHDALQAGLVYLPEERKRQGLVLEHSTADSISIGFNDLLTRAGLIRRQAESDRVRHALEAFCIRATGPKQPVGTLSGGNQQKALLGRWLERDPQVILLDEPTRGVDVGAKAEIHALMDRLAAQGKGLLLISSDLPEVLGMSDRVLVMARGTIVTELKGMEMTQEKVLLAASGLTESVSK